MSLSGKEPQDQGSETPLSSSGPSQSIFNFFEVMIRLCSIFSSVEVINEDTIEETQPSMVEAEEPLCNI